MIFEIVISGIILMLIWWLFSSGIIWPLLTALLIIVLIILLWPMFADKEVRVQPFSSNQKIHLDLYNQHSKDVYLFREKRIQFS